MKDKKYTIAEVFPLLKGCKRKKEYIEFDGFRVKVTSQRNSVFKRSLNCSECGIVGSYFKLDKGCDCETYHFNLYALDENGNEVLMTKDHIIPKSKGGKNIQSNYRTMCQPCNNARGNGDQQVISKKKKKKLLKAERLRIFKENQLEMLKEKYGYDGEFPRCCHLITCKNKRLYVGEFGDEDIGVKCFACGLTIGANALSKFLPTVEEFNSFGDYQSHRLSIVLNLWNGKIRPKELKMEFKTKQKELIK